MTPEPLDGNEIDALESLVIADGWRLVAGRVIEEIDAKRNSLERSGDKADEHRGFLAACRMFLKLPDQMRDEFKAQTKEK